MTQEYWDSLSQEVKLVLIEVRNKVAIQFGLEDADELVRYEAIKGALVLYDHFKEVFAAKLKDESHRVRLIAITSLAFDLELSVDQFKALMLEEESLSLKMTYLSLIEMREEKEKST